MDALESYRVGKLNFPFHTKIGGRRARGAENLARKLAKYGKMWLRGESLMLCEITKHLAVAINTWD